MLFPVTPSKLTLKISGKNKTLDLINGQEVQDSYCVMRADVLLKAMLTAMELKIESDKRAAQRAKRREKR